MGKIPKGQNLNVGGNMDTKIIFSVLIALAVWEVALKGILSGVSGQVQAQ